MGCNLKLPRGFRFDPTDEEMLLYLQWRLDDLNDSRLAFIPNIRMQDHDPSEFPWLGAVTGKDGIMYFFAVWDKKYLKGKRLDRQVKKGSMKARWKEVSGFEPIRSSDGDKEIGTKKNFVFKVGDSLIEWNMEEYSLEQVSICRVSKKCSQPRGTTKIDAKVHDDNESKLHPISISETHSYDLHISQSATETYNSNGQEEGQPYWCNFCSNWCPHDETLHRSLRNLCNRLHDQDQTLLFLLNHIHEGFERESPLPNVDHLGPQANNSKGKKEDGQSCISDTGNGPKRETLDMDSGDWKGSYEASEASIKASNFTVPINGVQQVDNLNPRLLDMPDRFLSLGTVLQDMPICSNATEEYVDNLDISNWFLSLDDNCQNWPNPAEENVDNPDTGNCQIADDIRMDLNDLIEIVDNPDTGNCQSADDTVPMDMDDATKTGNCVSSLDDSSKDYFL